MFLQAQEKETSDSESSLVFSLRDSQENPKNLGKKNGTCRILKVCTVYAKSLTLSPQSKESAMAIKLGKRVSFQNRRTVACVDSP